MHVPLQEPNYHDVYVQLVEKLDPRAVQDLLTPFTLRYIRILLRGNRIKQLTSERSLLKNLGMWLGRLSLARNKPIRFDQLDIKALLIEAFEQARFAVMLRARCFPRVLMAVKVTSRWSLWALQASLDRVQTYCVRSEPLPLAYSLSRL